MQLRHMSLASQTWKKVEICIYLKPEPLPTTP